MAVCSSPGWRTLERQGISLRYIVVPCLNGHGETGVSLRAVPHARKEDMPETTLEATVLKTVRIGGRENVDGEEVKELLAEDQSADDQPVPTANNGPDIAKKDVSNLKVQAVQ